MKRRSRILLASLWLMAAANLPAATPLEKFTDVRLVDNPSNDGDSFVVQAGPRPLHLRLYFVDSPESVVTTDADAKRVREQAQYFGITDAKKIVQYGRKAKEFTARALARPFTVYTAFADALGRSPGGRIYAFVVTADGQDLASLLVENGLARAYGYRRDGPDGTAAEELQRQFQDLELQATLKRSGVWAATDPEVLVKLRAQLHQDEKDLKELRQMSAGEPPKPGSVDLNSATARELQSISGIGPVLAEKIIAGRPYRSVEDLQRVSGIGPKLFAKTRPYLTVRRPPP